MNLTNLFRKNADTEESAVIASFDRAIHLEPLNLSKLSVKKLEQILNEGSAIFAAYSVLKSNPYHMQYYVGFAGVFDSFAVFRKEDDKLVAYSFGILNEQQQFMGLSEVWMFSDENLKKILKKDLAGATRVYLDKDLLSEEYPCLYPPVTMSDLNELLKRKESVSYGLPDWMKEGSYSASRIKEADLT